MVNPLSTVLLRVMLAGDMLWRQSVEGQEVEESNFVGEVRFEFPHACFRVKALQFSYFTAEARFYLLSSVPIEVDSGDSD